MAWVSIWFIHLLDIPSISSTNLFLKSYVSDILYVNLRACGSVAVSILQLEVMSCYRRKLLQIPYFLLLGVLAMVSLLIFLRDSIVSGFKIISDMHTSIPVFSPSSFSLLITWCPLFPSLHALTSNSLSIPTLDVYFISLSQWDSISFHGTFFLLSFFGPVDCSIVIHRSMKTIKWRSM